jgi:hypothetical protein
MSVETKLRIQHRADVIKALAHPSRVLIAQALIDGGTVRVRINGNGRRGHFDGFQAFVSDEGGWVGRGGKARARSILSFEVSVFAGVFPLRGFDRADTDTLVQEGSGMIFLSQTAWRNSQIVRERNDYYAETRQQACFHADHS